MKAPLVFRELCILHPACYILGWHFQELDWVFQILSVS